MRLVKCLRCHLCGVWSWTVSSALEGCFLCLPCYVDVLEERQRARSGEVGGRVDQSQSLQDPTRTNLDAGSSAPLGEGPDQRPDPLPYRQMDLFE